MSYGGNLLGDWSLKESDLGVRNWALFPCLPLPGWFWVSPFTAFCASSTTHLLPRQSSSLKSMSSEWQRHCWNWLSAIFSWVRWLTNWQAAISASTAQCLWDDACAWASDVTCFSPATVLLAQLWAGYWWLSTLYRTRWKELSRLNLREHVTGEPNSGYLRTQECLVFR